MLKIILLFVAIMLNAEILFNEGWNLKGGIDLNLSLFKNYNILIWKYKNNKWEYFNSNLNLDYPKIKSISKEEGFWIKAPFKMILNNNEILSSPYYKYKKIMNESYLQIKKSSNIIRDKNFFNNNFYLSNNKYLTFYMCGKYNRSELRFLDEFGLNEKRELKASVILNDINSSKYTFMQIFNKTKNKPLVRIAYYKKEIKGIPNKIWAVVNSNQFFLLTDKKRFNISLQINNYNLKIFINKKMKLDYNFSENSTNYFKLGMYLQDNGCAKSYFQNINFK